MNRTDSPDLLCMGCMEYRQIGGACPFCGFDEKNYTPAPHHLPARTILAGKYLVGRVLGEGGFGITYIGWDLNLDIKLAIKEYYPTGFVTRETTVTSTVTPYTGEKGDFFRSGREHFVEEAKRLAKFYTMPGIVSVKDFFLENNTAYIVMEYIEGPTLKKKLSDSGGKLPADEVFAMMQPLVRSLAEVHKAGIIHRDISPDNIMLTKDNKIKLLDFGAARAFTGSGNRSLSVMLKPGYAPEEQYRSRGAQGPWTDVYALCATIYRCITGVTPDESSERVRHDELQPPSAAGASIAPRLEKALMQGMAVLQENRIHSMEQLGTAFYGWPAPEEGIGQTVPAEYSPTPLPGKSDDVHTAPIRVNDETAQKRQAEKEGTFYETHKKQVWGTAVAAAILIVCIAAFSHRGGSAQAGHIVTASSDAGVSESSQEVSQGTASESSNVSGTSSAASESSSSSDNGENNKQGVVSYTINGQQHTLYAIEPMSFNSSAWEAELHPKEDTDDNQASANKHECVLFYFPKDASAGTEITDDISGSGFNYSPLAYRKDGDSDMYLFPVAVSYRNYTSTCDITIDKWDKSGGIAEGHFNAAIHFDSGDSVTFENGTFHINIKSDSSGF